MDVLLAATSDTFELWKEKGPSLMVNFIVILKDFLTDLLNVKYLMNYLI